LRDKIEDSRLKVFGSNCEHSPVRRGGYPDRADHEHRARLSPRESWLSLAVGCLFVFIRPALHPRPHRKVEQNQSSAHHKRSKGRLKTLRQGMDAVPRAAGAGEEERAHYGTSFRRFRRTNLEGPCFLPARHLCLEPWSRVRRHERPAYTFPSRNTECPVGACGRYGTALRY
jgi:hypothetical protein